MSSSDTIEEVPTGVASRASPLTRQAHDIFCQASRGWFVALGVCLLSPALLSGLVADDYLHQVMLSDSSALAQLKRPAWDLFRFANGVPDTTRALVGNGVFPWYTDPTARIAFFRPLSSLTHWLDYQLWPSLPAAMHLHSLLWFGLLIGVIGAIYRRFSDSAFAANLALLLFAIDDAHAPAVGWIANRNALIAICLSMPALLFHQRWRSGRSIHGAWFGPLFLTLGLAAGETAVIALAYLVAYAVCLDTGLWLRRIVALWRYGVVLVVWKFCSISLGYGVVGSGVYIDPLASPIDFVVATCERLPVLGLAMVGAPFADLWEVYPLFAGWLQPVVWLFAMFVLGVFALVLRPFILRKPMVRFWALGMALTLIPLCATFPHDRLLLGPSIGAMALIAEVLIAGWDHRQRWLSALGASGLAASHLVIAPLVAPLRAAAVGRVSDLLWAAEATLPSDAAVNQASVILLNTPLDPFAAYLPIYRASAGKPQPKQQLWLTSGIRPVSVKTLSTHAIALRPEGGFLYHSTQLMLRSAAASFKLGEQVRLDGVSIEIAALTDDGRPLEIVAHFDHALHDPHLRFLRWQNRGYVRLELPQVGQTIELPKVDLGRLLF